MLPTDTVYGIGADAFSAEAVQRLLDAKGRGRDMPPPVLIGEPSLIRALAIDVPEEAKDLVERHWPGPLTVICQIQPSLRMDLGDSEDTIALRVPDHDAGPGDPAPDRPDGGQQRQPERSAGRADLRRGDRPARRRGRGLPRRRTAGRAAAGAPSTIVDFTQRDDGRGAAASARSACARCSARPCPTSST